MNSYGYIGFDKYLDKIKGDFRSAVKVEWLYPDESIKCEFTNALYDINADVDVNYQNGSRRSCTLTLNNNKNEFPIDVNNIWIGQKFKLWMGIYLDDETPYYLPQGVFYVSNPSEVYNPNTKTVTINGVDKWTYLDGTLNGKLTGTYKTNVGTNLYDAIRGLLKLPNVVDGLSYVNGGDKGNIEKFFTVSHKDGFVWSESDGAYVSSDTTGLHSIILIANQNIDIRLQYSYYTQTSPEYFIFSINGKLIQRLQGYNSGINTYTGQLFTGDKIQFTLYNNKLSTYLDIFNIEATTYTPIDPIPPLLSNYFLSKTTTVNGVEKSVLECPYTATVERGQTYADILLEYATILCANIYYDVNGRLVLEPMSDTADDITDTNKEILWDYTVDEKTFLGLTQTYNFDKVYNDFIVLGNIMNGYQFKGRVQNRNPMSNTCIQRIGLKTKEPIEDNQYVSDEQCVELAKYYAKTDTILQKSGTINSVVLYHLDVNKLVTVSTPNNNMSKELFLITGFSLSTSGTMDVNVTSVNILKDFSVVEATVNG